MSRYWLKFVGESELHELGRGVSLGRHPQNSFQINALRFPGTSRFHASISVKAGMVTIRQLRHEGRYPLNGSRIVRGSKGISLVDDKPYELIAGDRVELGYDIHETGIDVAGAVLVLVGPGDNQDATFVE